MEKYQKPIDTLCDDMFKHIDNNDYIKFQFLERLDVIAQFAKTIGYDQEVMEYIKKKYKINDYGIPAVYNKNVLEFARNNLPETYDKIIASVEKLNSTTKERIVYLIDNYSKYLKQTSVLMPCIANKNPDVQTITDYIIKNGLWDPSEVDCRGSTHLHWAVNAPIGVFNKILEKTPRELISKKNNGGYTALHRALMSGCGFRAKTLIIQSDLQDLETKCKGPGKDMNALELTFYYCNKSKKSSMVDAIAAILIKKGVLKV